MAKLRITDSEIIKSGERELLDSIIGDLDWETVENIVKEKHQLRIQDDVEFKQGDLVVHNDSVAYRLDFDVKVTLTLLCDRAGNYLSFSTSGDFSNDVNPSEPDLVEADFKPDLEDLEALSEITDDPDDPGDSEAPEALLSETPEEAEAVLDDDIASQFPDLEPDPLSDPEAAPLPAADPQKSPEENISDMANQIEEMLSEIDAEENNV